MAKMKQGTQTGKVDCNYEGIRVGDKLRNPDGEVASVNEYGSLCIVGGEEVVGRKWDGSAWEIIPEAELDLIRTAATEDTSVTYTNEAPEKEAAGNDVEVAEDIEDADEENATSALEHFSDSELLEELRHRGYTGNFTHIIITREEVLL